MKFLKWLFRDKPQPKLLEYSPLNKVPALVYAPSKENALQQIQSMNSKLTAEQMMGAANTTSEARIKYMASIASYLADVGVVEDSWYSDDGDGKTDV